MAIRVYKDARGRARFCIEFQQSGVRVLRRLPPAATKAQAQALETKLRHEIFDQRSLGKIPDLTLEAAVDQWLRDRMHGKKDQRMPRQNAEHLRPFLKGRTVAEASEAAREAISAWTIALPIRPGTHNKPGGGLSAATVNRRLAVLKAAVHYAWKQGWTPENVSGRIERLREPPGREVYLSAQQIRKLAAAMPSPSLRAAVMLLAYTGLRANELLTLGRTDLAPGSLSVRQSKSGKPRLVPVAGPISHLLRHLPLQCSYSALQWAFRSARIKAGLPHVRIHDLRHSCASLLINAGVDLYTVGKILGHSTPATTARYSHLADSSLRKAMRRLK
jgi:integrase